MLAEIATDCSNPPWNKHAFPRNAAVGWWEARHVGKEPSPLYSGRWTCIGIYSAYMCFLIYKHFYFNS